MNEVQTIIAEATLEKNTLKLTCGEVDRDLYLKVDEVLKRLWGKWSNKHKGHVFNFDPIDLLAQYLETGDLPPKNETAYFPTPDIIIDKMLEEVVYARRILEPSAGQGAIADRIKQALPEAQIDCVEYLGINAGILKGKGYDVREGDFLEVEPDPVYDWVLMNPPFSLASDKKAYMTHLYHAMKFLREQGRAFCVIPPGWSYGSDKRSSEFRDFVAEHCQMMHDYPAGTFKESGTNIATMMLFLNKTKFEEDYHDTKFHLVATGSYGQEAYYLKHQEKTNEKYVDYVIDYFWKECPHDAISSRYKETYLKTLKQIKEEDD